MCEIRPSERKQDKRDPELTEMEEAVYPLVPDNTTRAVKLPRSRLTKTQTKPAWKWMISRALQPSRRTEKETAANTGGQETQSGCK